MRLPGPTWPPSLITGIGHEWMLVRLKVGVAAAERLLPADSKTSPQTRVLAQGLLTLHALSQNSPATHAKSLPTQ